MSDRQPPFVPPTWWQPVVVLPAAAVPLVQAPVEFGDPATIARHSRAKANHPGNTWLPGPADAKGRRIPPFILAPESIAANVEIDAAEAEMRRGLLDALARGELTCLVRISEPYGEHGAVARDEWVRARAVVTDWTWGTVTHRACGGSWTAHVCSAAELTPRARTVDEVADWMRRNVIHLKAQDRIAEAYRVLGCPISICQAAQRVLVEGGEVRGRGRPKKDRSARPAVRRQGE